MKAIHLALSLGIALSSGCSAYDRLGRLRVDLADDVRHHRMDEASGVEAKMLAISTNAYGEASDDDVAVRTGIAESWAQWGYVDRALRLAGQTIDELERRHGPNSEALVLAILSSARIHLIGRNWATAETTVDRASSICDVELRSESRPVYGKCERGSYDIDDYYREAGAFRKWAASYLRNDRRNKETWNRESAISKLTVLGRGHAENGAYPEALGYLQRCVDELRPRYEQPVPSRRPVWKADSGDVEVVVVDSAHSFTSQSPRCLEDLIDLRRKLGDDETALRLEAWQRESWARGPDLEEELASKMTFADRTWNDGYLTSYRANNLAFYYAGKGRNADAIRTYEEAVKYIDDAFERDGVFAGVFPTWLLLDELLGLGAALEQARRIADAQDVYRRAIKIAALGLHPRHAWRLESLARLARVQRGAGRHADSEATWGEYLRVAQRIRGTDHADYAFGLAGLAETLDAAGRTAEAAGARTRAASIRKAYAKRIASARDLPLPVALRSPPSPAN